MRFAAVTTAVALGAVAGVSAQAQLNQTYLNSIIGALTQSNLTGLAGVAGSLLNTTEGAALFAALPGSNKTILAPSNEAFANVSQDVASNTTLLAQILSYHILNGSVMPGANTSLYRSFYNSMMLPGNATEPVVFTNNMTIQTASQNVTVVAGPVAAGNLLVYVIDQVLALPQTISSVASTLFPSLAGVIQQVGILSPLEQIKGVTIFAPNDAAISGVMSALGSLNSTQIQTILANHVINGTVVYSTQLTSANYTSAAGEPFMFTSNSSGAYVMSGQSSAKIVQPNIVIANGVIHLIDNVLVNTMANQSAAAAAQSSYSMAATATTANGGGAIGSATASGSGAAASSTRASAGFATVQSGSVVGLLAAAIGLFAL